MKKLKLIMAFPLLLGSLLYGQTDTTAVKPVEPPMQDSLAVKPVQEDNLRDVPWFVERFRVSLGGYEMFNSTDVRISSTAPDAGDGTNIDFERDLGFDKSNSSFFGDIEWRMSSRSRFNFTYYSNRRNAEKTLEREISIGGDTYDINTNVDAYIKSDLYRLSYGYAIFSKPKYEIGLLIGTHTISTRLGIEVDGENVDAERNKDFNLTAPLLDFGIWGGYALSDRMALKWELNYFQLQIDTFDGRTLGYNLGLNYRIWKKFELGLGFAGLNFDVNYENTDKDRISDISWGYNGLTFVAAYTFGNKKWK